MLGKLINQRLQYSVNLREKHDCAARSLSSTKLKVTIETFGLLYMEIKLPTSDASDKARVGERRGSTTTARSLLTGAKQISPDVQTRETITSFIDA